MSIPQTEIQRRLFALRDEDYRTFTAKLNPTVDPDVIIGVRLPALRQLAKELKGTKEAEDFLSALPHTYLEENHLHCFLLAPCRDFDAAVQQVEAFLPYIDNWAVCDSIRVKAFEKEPERLLPYIDRWLLSGHTYTLRCSVLLLMTYLLGDRFRTEYAERVAVIQSTEYYVNMMRAWYFATALAKQYEAAVPYIEQRRLDQWTHNMTIRKAIESYRVTQEHKEYLRTLKQK